MDTTKSLIAAGELKPAGYDYITKDGVLIRRVYTGRRGLTTKWMRDGDPFLYRDLFCAYCGNKY